MNKDNAKDYLPLVQALAEGKDIQISDAAARGVWVTVEDPLFGGPAERYRIKPEPREVWLNVFPSGNIDLLVHETKESAYAITRDGVKVVRFREVIE